MGMKRRQKSICEAWHPTSPIVFCTRTPHKESEEHGASVISGYGRTEYLTWGRAVEVVPDGTAVRMTDAPGLTFERDVSAPHMSSFGRNPSALVLRPGDKQTGVTMQTKRVISNLGELVILHHSDWSGTTRCLWKAENGDSGVVKINSADPDGPDALREFLKVVLEAIGDG